MCSTDDDVALLSFKADIKCLTASAQESGHVVRRNERWASISRVLDAYLKAEVTLKWPSSAAYVRMKQLIQTDQVSRGQTIGTTSVSGGEGLLET